MHTVKTDISMPLPVSLNLDTQALYTLRLAIDVALDNKTLWTPTEREELTVMLRQLTKQYGVLINSERR